MHEEQRQIIRQYGPDSEYRSGSAWRLRNVYAGCDA